ncbi:FecR family protein [Pedobacter psychrotolerans]|uniref:Anti-sigma factor n=1 Tax=Pedobacter psychrotolerans TaxID=1843235 RepID=A0A4R2HLJ8_9SPHI|nr:FecR domain-containing protein [Pedobacter psychrotolerans]TCO30763.1 FecR family protein [Pedobacter psychrotolerans]GGE44604.1 anti-sigma factor [Pedobacter psychrotolerans]
MSEEKAKQLLTKYLDGAASPEECDQVANWYDALDTDQKALTGERKSAISEAMFQNLQLAIADQKARKPFFLQHWIKIAAALVIVTSVTFWLWQQHIGSGISNTQITTSTQAGERKKIILSDGSEITLAPLAKITYPEKFHTSSREVSIIEGEAFFSIAHDEKRPFRVKLPNHLNVSVLGTSFLIRAYQARKEVEVAVSTGKVAIKNDEKLLGTLIRNQKLLFNKVTGKSTLNVVHDIRPVEINFNGVTLTQVIRQMEYVYNIKIQLHQTSFANLKTTATFNSAQRPEEILDIICSLHHLKFSSDQNHQTFKIHK